jgi:NADH:ubiquinone reductase (non-electrogenic)
LELTQTSSQNLHTRATSLPPILSFFSSILRRMANARKEILIIGSGWAGSTLATTLDSTQYSITVISPETTTPYTPLLASAACGLYEFNLVETPIRHTNKRIKFVKARVESIDFKAKNVKCIPAFDDLAVKEFVLDYDVVVIAPGVSNFSLCIITLPS